MDFWAVLLLSLAMAMDACAVSMTNGMAESKMPFRKTLLIGTSFGVFQFVMPVIGYTITYFVAGAFESVFENIASWIAFALLAFLGGKMIVDCIVESRKCACNKDEECETQCGKLTFPKLLVQSVATSIDALAAGVSLRMTEISSGLWLGVWGTTGMIGVVTLCLSVAAVYIGKAVGDKLASKATLFGGIVLVLIAIKSLFA